MSYRDQSGFQSRTALDTNFETFVASSQKTHLLYDAHSTDCFWAPSCAIIIFLFSYIVCDGLSRCDLSRVSTGYDFLGQPCKNENPFVYWPALPINELEIDYFSPTCEPACSNDNQGHTDPLFPIRIVMRNSTSQTNSTPLVSIDWVPTMKYPVRLYDKFYCLPQDEKLAREIVDNNGLTSFWFSMLRVLDSLRAGSVLIALTLSVAVACSYVYIILTPNIFYFFWMNAIANPIIILMASSYFLVVTMYYFVHFRNSLFWILGLKLTLIAGFVGLLTGLYLIFDYVATRFKKVHKAANLTNASSVCLKDIPHVLIIPVLGSIFNIVLALITLIGTSALLTSYYSLPIPCVHPAQDSVSTTRSSYGILSQYTYDKRSLWYICALIGISFWCHELIHQMTKFCVTYAVSIWYFSVPDLCGTRYDVSIPNLGIIWLTLRYHIGSIHLLSIISMLSKGKSFALNLVQFSSSIIMRAAQYLTRKDLHFPISHFRFLHFMLDSSKKNSEFTIDGGLIECVLSCTDISSSSNRAYDVQHQSTPSAAILYEIGASNYRICVVSSALCWSGIMLLYSLHMSCFNQAQSSWYIANPYGFVCVTSVILLLVLRTIHSSFNHIAVTLLYCYCKELHDTPNSSPLFASDQLRGLIEENEAELRFSINSDSNIRAQSLLSNAARDLDLLQEATCGSSPINQSSYVLHQEI